MNQSHPIILDIEASGFGAGSYPIEVGFVMPDKRCHCYLIKPRSHWTHWDRSAEEVHGISRDTLMEHGKPAEDVAQELNRLLANKTVYSDGWGYDFSWVNHLFEESDIAMQFRIETLNALLKEDQLLIWENTRRKVLKELNIPRHRASSDARIIQETYIRTRQALSEQAI